MKTQKEIEQLAYKYAIIDFDDYAFSGYVKGYTQCQEDMTDKKYTLRDIEKAFLEGCASERRFSRRIDELDKYIISLNKQD